MASTRLPSGHTRLWFAVGLVLWLLGLWIIGSNEHRASAWRMAMQRHGGSVRVLSLDEGPETALDGRTVLLTGTPKIVEAPRDRDFHVRVDTPTLVRKVAMFQWHEVRVGGHDSYEQDWIDHPVDSSHFDQPRGHANRQAFPFSGKRFTAPQVALGEFILAPALVRALPMPFQPVAPDLSHVPANLQASFGVHGGMLTTVADGHPRLGDLRVRWLAQPLTTITVIARVQGDSLVPAAHARNGPGFDVQLGKRSLVDVFPDLPLPPHASWLWRVLAWLLAWAGAWLLVRVRHRQLAALASALGMGTVPLAILAGAMWLPASVLVAGVAWAVAVLAGSLAWASWHRVDGV